MVAAGLEMHVPPAATGLKLSTEIPVRFDHALVMPQVCNRPASVNRRAWVSGTESQTIAFRLCAGRSGAVEWRPQLPPAPELGPYLTLPLKGGRHGAG
jgi:hypothetical protein